jgi:hypothetical protein
MTFAVSGGFGHEADKRDRGAAAPERNSTWPAADEDQIWQ